MIQRPTWILLGLFAAVLAFAIYWQSTADQRSTADATPTVGVDLLLPFGEDTLAKVTIENAQGKRVELRREGDGPWMLSEPSGEEIDPTAAESAIGQLANLRVLTALEPASDLNVFGLENSTYTLILVLFGGERHTLEVGDVTPTQNGYYVQLNNGSPQVVNKFSLDPVLDLVENPPILPTATLETSGTVEGTNTTGTSDVTPTLEP